MLKVKVRKKNKTIELGKVKRTETEGSSDPCSTLQAESPERERERANFFTRRGKSSLLSVMDCKAIPFPIPVVVVVVVGV